MSCEHNRAMAAAAGGKNGVPKIASQNASLAGMSVAAKFSDSPAVATEKTANEKQGGRSSLVKSGAVIAGTSVLAGGLAAAGAKVTYLGAMKVYTKEKFIVDHLARQFEGAATALDGVLRTGYNGRLDRKLAEQAAENIVNARISLDVAKSRLSDSTYQKLNTVFSHVEDAAKRLARPVNKSLGGIPVDMEGVRVYKALYAQKSLQAFEKTAATLSALPKDHTFKAAAVAAGVTLTAGVAFEMGRRAKKKREQAAREAKLAEDQKELDILETFRDQKPDQEGIRALTQTYGPQRVLKVIRNERADLNPDGQPSHQALDDYYAGAEETVGQVYKSQISDRVNQIIAQDLDRDESKISPETNWNDLKASQLDRAFLIMDFEEEFGVEVPDQDAKNLSTVGHVVDYFHSRLMSSKQL